MTRRRIRAIALGTGLALVLSWFTLPGEPWTLLPDAAAASTSSKTTPARKGATTAKTSSAKKTATKASTSGKKSTSTKKSTTVKSTKSGGKKSTAKKAVTRKSTRRKPAAVVAFDPARPNTLRAQAAVVVDRQTGRIVWGKNEESPRPIASLTKLMTALVFLDHAVPLTDSITVTMNDITGAGRSHVRAGNRVSIGDLLRCSLISSDNAATRVLARSTGLSNAEFIREMNVKAQAMDLHETNYTEVTGLDANNTSTALDQARLLDAVSQEPLLSGIMQMESYSFRCGKRVETLTNTNRLLRSRSDIAGGKTGFTRPAGYCLATHIGENANPHLTTVVLGAPTNASRFAESAKLIDWALRLASPAASASAPARRR